jgi:putative ABC transport system permease protein
MSRIDLQIAWRNLSRNRRRSLLAIGAIGVGQFTLVFVSGMMAGMFDQMLAGITGPLVGHVQVHHEEWRDERGMALTIDSLETALSETKSLETVRAVFPRIYAPVLSAYGEETDEPPPAEIGMIVGVDFAAESVDGGLLESIDPPEDGVLVGKVLANRLGVAAGELVAVIGQDVDEFPVTELFKVADIIESPVGLVQEMGIVVPIDQAQTLFALPDQAHELVIIGKDSDEADALAAQLAGLNTIRGAEVLTWREALPELAGMMSFKGYVDIVFVGILFVAAAAGIANTAMMSTFERLKEFGMLLALGTRPPRIVNMVVIESVLLGVIGVIVGSVVGAAVVFVTSQTGIDYTVFAGENFEEFTFSGLVMSYVFYPDFQIQSVIYGVVAVTLVSVVASTWPAMLAARLEPIEALRS